MDDNDDEYIIGVVREIQKGKLVVDKQKTRMSGGKSFEEAYEAIRIRAAGSDEDEEEIEFSMGKLIRQASLSKTTDHTIPTPKGAATSASSSKKVVRELETQKSLVSENMGFDKKPKSGGLQQKMIVQEKSRLRRTQSWAPPVPVKRSSEEDIKAQIKFWARAVATNVRPEC